MTTSIASQPILSKQLKHDNKPLRIGIVVGEESGDILGAGLMQALKQHYGAIEFSGIGGHRMLAEGFHSFFPQDRLAVMGFVEPLKRLPELLRIRRFLKAHFIANPPDVFIGIDSPDFNLNIEIALREQGIKTAHYVSPSVWAWRQGRIKKIRRAVDLMLTLFPFENAIYDQHAIKAVCVGHPLADTIDLVTDTEQARANLQLNLTPGTKVIALLPGSRQAEVSRLGEIFFSVAERLQQKFPGIYFLCPAANPARLVQLQHLQKQFPDVPLQLLEGQSHLAMAAADLVIMASGTTTLEAMLFKKPMIIAYKVATLSYWIYRSLVKVSMIGLPNLLAGRLVVPEFIQEDATPDNILRAATEFLVNNQTRDSIEHEFNRLHAMLRKNGNQIAAQAIIQLIEAQ